MTIGATSSGFGAADPGLHGRASPRSAGAGPRGADSQAEQREVAELERTDREVRAHEAAHLAAAGGLARGVSFEFVTGPDGRQYAIAGEVSIDASPVEGDPEKTIQKAQQIRAAARAPAQPSGQDQQVAAQAAQMEQAARQELAERHRRDQAEALKSSGALDLQDSRSRIEAFA